LLAALEPGWQRLERARRLAGLSRSELARRAGASRPTLAAYAAGAKSPNLATAERIARAAGFDLDLVPRPAFREVAVGRGRAVYVPAVLPRLPVDRALGRVRLPLRLNWSRRPRVPPDRPAPARHGLRDRAAGGQRRGHPRHVDGVLLVDLWPDLVLPAPVRHAWQPLISSISGHSAA
jgi:transcriptional regulator with XRE-family HTH domain